LRNKEVREMKTFFSTCRDGEKGSVEAISMYTVIGQLQATFGLDIIKIEEMKDI
jgi:hypothetical protein